MIHALVFITVSTLPTCIASGQAVEENSHVTQDTSLAEAQALDSLVSGVIPPGGGTIELSDFATVTFPAGAFDSALEVTLQATSEPEERGLFKISVGLRAADHALRILTGRRRPSAAIQVAVVVPEVFLNHVPADRVPVLFVIGRYSSPSETVDDFYRLESEFDEARRLLTAKVEPRKFQEYEAGRGLQAVLMISQGPKQR